MNRRITPQDATPVVLYMHIPKAAGTTISGVLFDCLRKKERSCEEHGHLMSGVYYYPSGFIAPLRETQSEEARRVLARNDLTAVMGHFQFGIHRQLPVPATYITILRPPLDRVVSLYYFHRLVQQRWRNLEGKTLPDEMDLEAFVREIPYKEIDNGQTRRISGCDPPIGQCSAAMLYQAKQNLRNHFAVVGTTMRLEETFVLMQQRFDWTDDVAFYPQNVNPARPSSGALSSSTRDAVLSQNALDSELYDFAAGLLDEAIRAGGETFSQNVHRLKERNARLREKENGSPSDAE